MSIIGRLVVGGLVAAFAVAANVSPADATTGGTTGDPAELLPVEGASYVVDAIGPADIALPDGRVLRLPEGSVVSTVGNEVSATTPFGDVVTISSRAAQARASSNYYPPVTITHSRSQVENVYRAVNNVGNVCRFVPLPYLASIGCSASSAVRNAYTQAHYQSKRVRVDFYRSKVCGSCSYSKYTVVR